MPEIPGPAAPPDDARLARCCAEVRRLVVERAHASNVGHVGSALSVVETLCTLWLRVMRAPGTDESDRDRFILAKGHAALAYYALLHKVGLLDAAELATYCRDGSRLGVHPERGVPGVEVGTGSLGQGLSVACGIALALRRRGSSARVFVLMSDAECNEGQVWEAAMFAAHHRLDNLIAAVDLNGMQAFGPTADVLDMAPMARRWEAFGWHAVDADGHDVASLRRAFTEGLAARRGPAVVLARTVLGRGVSFMEGRLEWHYRNLSPPLAAAALGEIGGAR